MLSDDIKISIVRNAEHEIKPKEVVHSPAQAVPSYFPKHYCLSLSHILGSFPLPSTDFIFGFRVTILMIQITEVESRKHTSDLNIPEFS